MRSSQPGTKLRQISSIAKIVPAPNPNKTAPLTKALHVQNSTQQRKFLVQTARSHRCVQLRAKKMANNHLLVKLNSSRRDRWIMKIQLQVVYSSRRKTTTSHSKRTRARRRKSEQKKPKKQVQSLGSLESPILTSKNLQVLSASQYHRQTLQLVLVMISQAPSR